MGSFSLGHWLIVIAVIVLLFGAGRIPSLMSDMAKGIKAFRSGMKDDSEAQAAADPKLEPPRDGVPPRT